MDTSSAKVSSPESSHETSAPSMASGPSLRRQESKEVKDVKEKVGMKATVETLDYNNLEEGLDVSGKINETLAKKVSEDDTSSGTSGGAYRGMTPAQIKAQLLSKIPDEKVMKKQIEGEIKKEIKYLHKKAIKLMRSRGNVSYFEMANVMKKIRELKGILMDLIKASLESLKSLWLRFVHGIL